MAVDVRQVKGGRAVVFRNAVLLIGLKNSRRSPVSVKQIARVVDWPRFDPPSHNADSYVNLLLPQYDSVEDRNSAIEAGSNGSGTTLLTFGHHVSV